MIWNAIIYNTNDMKVKVSTLLVLTCISQTNTYDHLTPCAWERCKNVVVTSPLTSDVVVIIQ